MWVLTACASTSTYPTRVACTLLPTHHITSTPSLQDANVSDPLPILEVEKVYYALFRNPFVDSLYVFFFMRSACSCRWGFACFVPMLYCPGALDSWKFFHWTPRSCRWGSACLASVPCFSGTLIPRTFQTRAGLVEHNFRVFREIALLATVLSSETFFGPGDSL